MKIREFAEFCDLHSHIKAVRMTHKDKIEMLKNARDSMMDGASMLFEPNKLFCFGVELIVDDNARKPIVVHYPCKHCGASSYKMGKCEYCGGR